MATPKLITLTDARSQAAEAYRTLRTNLMFSSVEKPITTLMITSPVESADKSSAIANLAVTFAQGGNKTILVDADLRKPAQHDIWGVNSKQGLTTMVLEAGALATPPLVETSVEKLQLLPCGVLLPNPADILSSQKMNEVIGVLKARAHYILFDVPPVLAATDAAALGVKLDGALLIIRSGQTKREHAARARQTLERVHVRILGAVLTNAPRENTSNYG
jgi:non-specific protein-tyrosine kinase